jgi:transcriptional regulator with XRE-family HTH domain
MNAKELRLHRLSLGLSQTQLGHYFGIHYRTVLRWENKRLSVPEWMPFAMTGLEQFLTKGKKKKKGGK